MFPHRKDYISGCERCSHDSGGRCKIVGLGAMKSIDLLKPYGEGHFLIKACGLTTLKKTKFGNFSQQSHGFHDRVSGISLMSDHLSLIGFRCPLTKCLRFACLGENSQVLGYFSYESILWGSDVCEEIISQLECRSLASDRVPCTRKCQQWLDDWSDEEAGESHEYDETDIVAGIGSSFEIEVQMRKSDLSFQSSLNPHVIDFDQNILRIADQNRTHVVYADMGRVHFDFDNHKTIISI